MIEKLKTLEDKIFKTETGEYLTIPELGVPKPISDKINELVGAVNAIQKEREAERFEIQEWIGILEAVRESVNVHEKQIDELQNRITAFDDPTYHEEPVENAIISKMENVAENGNFAKNAKNLTPGGRIRIDGLDDPYAEQRKWVGKLCRFWDIDNDNLYYGPLTKIWDTEPYCYECNHRVCYAHCEPVKDDIIYKGGDNE